MSVQNDYNPLYMTAAKYACKISHLQFRKHYQHIRTQFTSVHHPCNNVWGLHYSVPLPVVSCLVVRVVENGVWQCVVTTSKGSVPLIKQHQLNRPENTTFNSSSSDTKESSIPWNWDNRHTGKKHFMNTGSHFAYKHHITLTSTHSKRGNQHKGIITVQTELNLLIHLFWT